MVQSIPNNIFIFLKHTYKNERDNKNNVGANNTQYSTFKGMGN